MAIMYGMSVKDFWESDPSLFWAYRFSYFKKLEGENKIFNNNAWLQGIYIQSAIMSSLSAFFSNEKIEYPNKPFDNDENSKEEIENKKQQEIQNQVNDIKARIAQVNAIRKSSTT